MCAFALAVLGASACRFEVDNAEQKERTGVIYKALEAELPKDVMLSVAPSPISSGFCTTHVPRIEQMDCLHFYVLVDGAGSPLNQVRDAITKVCGDSACQRTRATAISLTVVARQPDYSGGATPYAVSEGLVLLKSNATFDIWNRKWIA